MTKRLTLILALAFVVGIACTAYAEVQNVKVSGDLTIRGILRKNYTTTDKGGLRVVAVGSKVEARDNLLSTTRLRIDADLTDNVATTIRLLNERDWNDTNTASPTATQDDINLDLAYVTLKELLSVPVADKPITLKLGRQDIRLGSGLIFGDGSRGNPDAILESDFAARKAFDAALLTTDLSDDLSVNLAYIKLAENPQTTTDDFDAYVLDAIYKLNDHCNTVLDGYYVLGKYSSPNNALSGVTATSSRATSVHVAGLRITSEPINKLSLEGELAHEFGTYNKTVGIVRKLSALAGDLGAKYAFEQKYSPVLGVKYGFRSGKDATNNATVVDKYRGWIALYEDQINGVILDPNTNTHFVNVSGKIKPKDDVTLAADYYRYYWDEKPVSSSTTKDKRHRGDEVDLNLIYDYTEDVQLGLLNAYFFPGSSYTGDSDRTGVEVVGSMKVTF